MVLARHVLLIDSSSSQFSAKAKLIAALAASDAAGEAAGRATRDSLNGF
jgi:hypothetical protein